MQKTQKILGFTLTELIVVITILAILGSIGFIVLQKHLSESRNAKRWMDIANLSKTLETSLAERWDYPVPDNGKTITFSWWNVWIQWTIWSSLIERLNIFSSIPVDPKFQAEYTYSKLLAKWNKLTSYAIGWLLEQGDLALNTLESAYANSPKNTIATAYVVSNYNNLVAKTQSGGTCYTIALPSIILADIPSSGQLESIGSGAFVFPGKDTIPASYIGKITNLSSLTGSTEFRNYSTDRDAVILSDSCNLPSTPQELALFSNKLKGAYAQTPLEQESSYIPFTKTIDALSQIGLSKDVINIHLGGNIAWEDAQVTPAFSCVSQPSIEHATTFTIGSPTKFFQTWIYSSTPGNCTFACESGYAWNGSSCVPNACSGDLASTNGVSNGTQALGGTWTYSPTPGVCTYDCANWHTYSGATNKCEPNACSSTTLLVGTSPNDHSYTIPEVIHGGNTTTTSAPKTIIWGTLTYSQSFSCSLGVFSLSGSETANTPTCDVNYAPSGSSCTANTQTFTCAAKPALNAMWNTVSSYTQTWNGSTWAPANSATTYNTTADTVSCRYKCNTSYHTEDLGASCISDTRSCTIANGNGSQSWNGAAWGSCVVTTCNSGYVNQANTCIADVCGGTVPVNGTSNATSQTIAQNWAYNTTAGVCTFKCNPNYTWNGTNACVANTQTFTCAAKPASNTMWNTVASYTQTWNGSAWTPANSTTAYNTTADTASCRYKCSTSYHTENAGVSCVSDTRSCTITNGVGSQSWNGSSWGTCTVTSCNWGYTQSGNSCVANGGTWVMKWGGCWTNLPWYEWYTTSCPAWATGLGACSPYGQQCFVISVPGGMCPTINNIRYFRCE